MRANNLFAKPLLFIYLLFAHPNYTINLLTINTKLCPYMQGTYDASATNFSKTKKATWIAAVVSRVLNDE